MSKRYKGYMRTIIGQSGSEACDFRETHYREAGVAPSPLAGMPLLEAHELINKWNRDQAIVHPRYIFWLN